MEEFDFSKALEEVKKGAKIDGKDGVLAPLIKQLTEAALEGESDSHLSEHLSNNLKNGNSSKNNEEFSRRLSPLCSHEQKR